MYDDDPFCKSNMPHKGASIVMSGGDAETWGENEHGYFSLSSGKFISKEDWGKYGFSNEPCIDIAWPGESTEKKEE